MKNRAKFSDLTRDWPADRRDAVDRTKMQLRAELEVGGAAR